MTEKRSCVFEYPLLYPMDAETWKNKIVTTNNIQWNISYMDNTTGNIPSGTFHQPNCYEHTLSPRFVTPISIDMAIHAMRYASYSILDNTATITVNIKKRSGVSVHFALAPSGFKNDPTVSDFANFTGSHCVTEGDLTTSFNLCWSRRRTDSDIIYSNPLNGQPESDVNSGILTNYNSEYDGPMAVWYIDAMVLDPKNPSSIRQGENCGTISISFNMDVGSLCPSEMTRNLLSWGINGKFKFIEPDDGGDVPDPPDGSTTFSKTGLTTFTAASVQTADTPIPKLITTEPVSNPLYTSTQIADKSYITVFSARQKLTRFAENLLRQRNDQELKEIRQSLGEFKFSVPLWPKDRVSLSDQHLIVSRESVFRGITAATGSSDEILNGFEICPYSTYPELLSHLGITSQIIATYTIAEQKAFGIEWTKSAGRKYSMALVPGSYGLMFHQQVIWGQNTHTTRNLENGALMLGIDDTTGLDYLSTAKSVISFPAVTIPREPELPASLQYMPDKVKKAYLKSAPKTADVIPKFSSSHIANFGIEGSALGNESSNSFCNAASIVIGGCKVLGRFVAACQGEKSITKEGVGDSILLSYAKFIYPDDAVVGRIGVNPITQAMLEASFRIFRTASQNHIVGLQTTVGSTIQVDVDMRIQCKNTIISRPGASTGISVISPQVSYTTTFGVFAALINPISDLASSISTAVCLSSPIRSVTQVANCINMMLNTSGGAGDSYYTGTSELTYGAGIHTAVAWPNELINAKLQQVPVSAGAEIFVFLGMDIEVCIDTPCALMDTYPGGNTHSIYVIPGGAVQPVGSLTVLPSNYDLTVTDNDIRVSYSGTIPTTPDPAITILSRKGGFSITHGPLKQDHSKQPRISPVKPFFH